MARNKDYPPELLAMSGISQAFYIARRKKEEARPILWSTRLAESGVIVHELLPAFTDYNNCKLSEIQQYRSRK